MMDNKRVDVVILAAGVGSRLQPITDEMPKCLVKVAGRPILGWLLHQFQDISDLVDQVHVISGYRANDVCQFVNSVSLPVNVIVNKDYRTTNNMYSLYLSFPFLNSSRDLMVVNGDCIYGAGVVENLAKQSSSAIAVDSSVYYEESMKVRISAGCARAISKEIKPGAGVFTSIDLYRFSQHDKRLLASVVHSFVKNGELTQWTEVAINQMLQDEDTCVQVYDIAGKPWIEIDTLDDLKKAETLFSKWA